jgi:hypothetical protein
MIDGITPAYYTFTSNGNGVCIVKSNPSSTLDSILAVGLAPYDSSICLVDSPTGEGSIETCTFSCTANRIYFITIFAWEYTFGTDTPYVTCPTTPTTTTTTIPSTTTSTITTTTIPDLITTTTTSTITTTSTTTTTIPSTTTTQVLTCESFGYASYCLSGYYCDYVQTAVNLKCCICEQISNRTAEIEKTCSVCPEPDNWSECIDNSEVRTSYICGESTSYQCKEYEETRSCSSSIYNLQMFWSVIAAFIIIILFVLAIYIFFSSKYQKGYVPEKGKLREDLDKTKYFVICPYCNAKNKINANYCNNCGVQLRE